MKLTNSFLVSANNISKYCTNPSVVLEAMKRTMMRTMLLLHARYVSDLFKCLRRNKIGTSSVVNLCQKACERLPENRSRTLTSIVIRWKMIDSMNELRKAKRENTSTWREVRPLLVSEHVLGAYENLWTVEKTEYARYLRKNKSSKIEFLKKKFCRETLLPDQLRGVIIADQDIPEEFTSSPRTYGGTTISEDEEQLLSLPPNFSIYDRVDSTECEAQVEKGLSKLRWTLQKKARQEEEGNEEEEEQAARSYFDPESRTFDFRNMRGTDLPFNKRITLPDAMGLRFSNRHVTVPNSS